MEEMEIASKVLIVGGVVNLAYAFLTGIFLGTVRSKKPEAPKYLVYAHMGPLIHCPILLGLVFAVDLSPLPSAVETLATSLLVASSVLLAAKDTLNWVQGVTDEFAERSPGFFLGAAYMFIATLGLLILMVGVFRGL